MNRKQIIVSLLFNQMFDLHAEKAVAVDQCCHRVDVLETTVVRASKPNRTEPIKMLQAAGSGCLLTDLLSA